MTNDNAVRDIDRICDLIRKIGMAMLVIRDGDKLPMVAAALVSGRRPDFRDNNRKLAL